MIQISFVENDEQKLFEEHPPATSIKDFPSFKNPEQLHISLMYLRLMWAG